uniref:Uncharacterized protein with conserved CXXC pairs n=2 Tax=Bacteria TaxID=2 RepID=E7C4J2_9BACT|nr:uncharacterized protein with conserved CXXC pairs [uncultured Gemmatimonadales bacterium HF0200_36I24]ADI22366.1 uncharacterized protein with conserved CXXC pairs [uncultured nuHF2 cluster bacterium HF0500_02A10]
MKGKESKDLCNICWSAKAVLHLTQIENNQMSSFHLCEKCAADKGVDLPKESVDIPLTGFLAQIGEDLADQQSSESSDVCFFCGLAFNDFREAGQLGCPHCYTTFEVHIRGLLRRIHGSTQHVGKVYLSPDPNISEMEEQLEILRHKLQRAVDSENFERAAEIRDKIRDMEPAGS